MIMNPLKVFSVLFEKQLAVKSILTDMAKISNPWDLVALLAVGRREREMSVGVLIFELGSLGRRQYWLLILR